MNSSSYAPPRRSLDALIIVGVIMPGGMITFDIPSPLSPDEFYEVIFGTV